MALSSTRTRAAPRAMSPRPVGSGPAISVTEGCVRMRTEGASAGSFHSSIGQGFLWRREEKRQQIPFGEEEKEAQRPSYWQASQVGSSMEHCLGAAGETATAFSLPSVRLSVDFSTWVAERERREEV